MGLIDIILIGIGLSMDAFAVSICKGLKMKQIDLRQSFVIALFFGGFQAFMPFAGYILSVQFVKYITMYSHWVAFALLFIIGMNMIHEAVKSEEEEEYGRAVLDLKELTGLAVATSIDALAVGVSFGTMGDKLQLSLALTVTIIGIITFIVSVMGVFIGNIFGSRYRAKAEIFGGILLVCIGIKVVLEHYL